MYNWSQAHENAFAAAFAGIDCGDLDRYEVEVEARANVPGVVWEGQRTIGSEYYGLEISGSDQDARLICAVNTARMIADSGF